jgi:ubiquinone/menaquinone biosynthesis C-methylase UbiE
MDIRTRLCYELSRRRMLPPEQRNADQDAYGAWRQDSLARSWSAFDDNRIAGKDVLDFGCGEGPLTLFLAKEKKPRAILGVDISEPGITKANSRLAQTPIPAGVQVEFQLGTTAGLPVPDASFDTLLAFDCLEHVMSPEAILKDWHRVLRPGGRCLIEWFPYKGPWGPHMEALIPIPWAHVVFGENAMMRTAEAIYDLPEFVPRHWDIDENGVKKPNKWRNWASFSEQNYINKLDISTFRRIASNAGFRIDRLECHSFGGSVARQLIGKSLMGLPGIGEHFVSYVIIELIR